MKNIIIAFGIVLFASACSEDKGSVEQTEKEVFVIHDEVMPKMGQLMELKTGLSKEISAIDSLVKITPNDSLQKRKEEALALSVALTEADQGMMNWMHDYNGDSLKALSGEEAIKAMNAEKTKISAVRDKMLESMAKAEQFLKK
ncbi:viral A-type inclusion protein [Runella salmonicolor]|uniref:Viral A-type inclusion protein n=1 Tax=Runella salmonicolor TaxID=2950278 RepID=A0ABT1FKW8_9BACT|nr:viral A-type inclusion protein [Runella salmonicolor]MCP1382384.1 viral A-type inclusion protein [Runella salmonicolor]